MDYLIPAYSEDFRVRHKVTVDQGQEWPMLISEQDDSYLTRVERRLGRLLTEDEAERLLEAYHSPEPSNLPDWDQIPF